MIIRIIAETKCFAKTKKLSNIYEIKLTQGVIGKLFAFHKKVGQVKYVLQPFRNKYAPLFKIGTYDANM